MSDTIFVPIFIHAIMDYSPNPLVFIETIVGTASWLIFVKTKKSHEEETL